ASLSVSLALVEKDGCRTGIGREADSDSCKALPMDVADEVYGRDFTWARDMTCPEAGFADAGRKSAGSSMIAGERAIPVSRYEMLEAGGPITLVGGAPHAELTIYRKSRQDIEAQWVATRDADAERLKPFIKPLRDAEVLTAATTATSRGFAPL